MATLPPLSTSRRCLLTSGAHAIYIWRVLLRELTVLPASLFTLWRDAITGMIWTKFAVMVVAHDKFLRQSKSMTTDYVDVTDMSPAAHCSVGGQEVSSRRGELITGWRVYISWPPFYWLSNEIGSIACRKSGPQVQTYRREQIAVTNFVEKKLRL